MPTRRIGWGYDEKGVRGAKRSEITYTDIRFDVELPESLFRPQS